MGGTRPDRGLAREVFRPKQALLVITLRGLLV